MNSYINIVKRILNEGVIKHNRTGVDALTIAGAMFQHDMGDGFPLLTTKKVSLKNIAVELEFFIKGLTDKKWLQDRGCHIWDEWANPEKVKNRFNEWQEVTKTQVLNKEEVCKINKGIQKEENDLGPIYGWQWRNFGDEYSRAIGRNFGDGYTQATRKDFDQLRNIVETLKTNPSDRRMICSAWNPLDMNKMALPPCHYSFQVTVINNKLNLLWNQRSVDTALGLPYNIASYGLLLKLLAKEAELEEGMLIGFLADTHIYVNHLDAIKEQIQREPKELPSVEITNFSSIFNWEYTDILMEDYDHHSSIKYEVAV